MIARLLRAALSTVALASFCLVSGSAYGQTLPVIDVLVLYTATTQIEFAKRGRQIEKEIAFVAHMQNRIFESSGVQAQVKVTAKLWAEFDEATNTPAQLKCDAAALNCAENNLQIGLISYIVAETAAGDKFAIRQHRKQAGAALVSLWMWRGGWDTTGSAAAGLKKSDFQAGAAFASQQTFLSLITAEKAWLWWHFAHELGHNLGLGDSGDPPGDLVKTDAFGYVDTQYPFRTIMAGDGECEQAGFAACLRIPLYSNADANFTYLGRPIGKVGRNAVTTLNATAAFVADYSNHLP